MQYVALLVGYNDSHRRWPDLTADEQQREIETHAAFAQAFAEREGCTLLSGYALTGGDEATVVRRSGSDVTLTDGPFSEVTENIGGLYAFEAPDLDVAVELVSLLSYYVIELRPVDLTVS